MTRNDLTPDDVISVLFTVTPDLTAEFPALAARKIGFHAVPLMCATEIPVPGAMPRVVRLMAHVDTDRPPRGDPARVPARRGGAPPGHRAVVRSRPADVIPNGGRRHDRPAAQTCSSRGTGLIGTSVALALREKGTEVWLSDADPGDRQARRRPRGRHGRARTCATPRGSRTSRCSRCRRPWSARSSRSRRSARVADVVHRCRQRQGAAGRGRPGSSAATCESFVPGHPLAGRERHGPAAAQADLFLGRTWALCPLPETSPPPSTR